MGVIHQKRRVETKGAMETCAREVAKRRSHWRKKPLVVLSDAHLLRLALRHMVRDYEPALLY